MKNFIVIIFVLSLNAWSQNQHEPQHWEKLTSPQATIIFKKGQEQDAQKIANTIQYIQENNNASIGNHQQPIDIILRGNTVESNGFVTLSPFRSEFYNTAPQSFNSLGTTNWISTLAIHEYRHVQQYLNHKKGLTKALHYIFGDSGWGAGSILAVPDWYFEGDAVVMETALTKSGRGRLPKFSSLQRAISKSGTIYTYQKTRNGSYKDITPNHYVTGYQMLNFYRNHFDASKLDDIAGKAAAFKFPFYGFSQQLKKETQLTTTDMYHAALTENKMKWKKQRNLLGVSDYNRISKKNNRATLYAFPQIDERGNIITLKTTFDEISTFYKINSKGEETKITTSVINIDPYFSYQNNKLVYSGIQYHPRYNYTNYNNLYIYDIITKKRKQLTHKKRYFSPSFNNDASKIIAIENDQNISKIVVLNSRNGNTITQLKVSGHASRPQFIAEEVYAYLLHNDHQLAIFKIDKDGNKTQLSPWTNHSIDHIRVDQDFIYYSASFNGIENIYQTPVDGSQIINQITNVAVGAYQPITKHDNIYFVEQTKNGNKISFSKISPIPFKIKEPIEMDWNNNKTVVFENGYMLKKIKHTNFNTSAYTSSFKNLKLHDWSYRLDDEIISTKATATNLLNDFSLSNELSFYPNEINSSGIGFSASYKKWFPTLNLGIDYTRRNFNKSLEDQFGILHEGNIAYNLFSVSPSLTIPLAQVKGNYVNNMYFNLGFKYYEKSTSTFTFRETKQETEVKNTSLHYGLCTMSIDASSIRRKAKQHISSHGGISTKLEYNRTMFGAINKYYFNTLNYIFLPGFIKSHNCFMSFAYRQIDQGKDRVNLNLNTDNFSYARGFIINPSIAAQKISINYQFPIVYPDFGILGVSYFKRIRANLFTDFSTITDLQNNKSRQNSVGIEVIFDNTFFNIRQAEVGIGYRGSYLLTNDIGSTNHRKYVHGIFISTALF